MLMNVDSIFIALMVNKEGGKYFASFLLSSYFGSIKNHHYCLKSIGQAFKYTSLPLIECSNGSFDWINNQPQK